MMFITILFQATDRLEPIPTQNNETINSNKNENEEDCEDGGRDSN